MVNMREIAKEYRLGHWAQIMQTRNESGMSIKAYCEKEGIHPNRYFYWQKKLREAALAVAVQNEMIATTPQLSPANVPQGWAICETEQPRASAQNGLQIEIGKSRIIVESGTNPELLANACRMLVSLC